MSSHSILRTLAMLTVSTMSSVAVYSPTSHAEDQPAEAEAPALDVATFDISGMVTPSCPVLLEAAVSRIDGVENVEASLEKKKAWVRFRRGATTPDQIIAVIAGDTSYAATLAELRAAK